MAVAQAIDTLALRAHTRFLSTDLLEGRGAGTRGEHVAALYIAAQLMRIGIAPADTSGDYFQRVPLKRARIDHARTTLGLRDGSGNQHFISNRDFVWNTGGPRSLRAFSGRLIFVGAPGDAHLEDASQTRGRVIVVAGPLGGAASTLIPAWQRAGAAAVVLLVPDSNTFNLYARSRGDARYFVAADLADPIWQQDMPVVIAGPVLTRALLQGVDTRQPNVLNERELRAEISVTIDDVHASNVAGLIPGADPRRAAEVVAFSAHYDHLGISLPNARGDSIYNGFSDNAAGVAMLLAMGDVLRRTPPARSVLLLFFTAEERGLLGSSYYAAQPIVPNERMAALINLDAGAPPAPPLEWRIAGGAASTLGDVAARVAQARGWSAELGLGSPNSDHWPFLQRNIPAIFIIPGNRWEGVTPRQQAALRARWDRYHRPEDEWSEDFPFSGLQRYAEYALDVGRAAANAPERPRMKP